MNTSTTAATINKQKRTKNTAKPTAIDEFDW
jgi:hypothetical protein